MRMSVQRPTLSGPINILTAMTHFFYPIPISCSFISHTRRCNNEVCVTQSTKMKVAEVGYSRYSLVANLFTRSGITNSCFLPWPDFLSGLYAMIICHFTDTKSPFNFHDAKAKTPIKPSHNPKMRW